MKAKFLVTTEGGKAAAALGWAVLYVVRNTANPDLVWAAFAQKFDAVRYADQRNGGL